MSRKKRILNYEYESRSRHGEMNCQLCRKEIKAGEAIVGGKHQMPI